MSEGGVAKGDPSSSCNCGEALVKHVHWRVDVDFPARVLHCSAQLSGKVLTPATCSHLILDVCELNVISVLESGSGAVLDYEVIVPPATTEKWRSCLKIALPRGDADGAEFSVTVSYETAPSCSAVQWLEPAQTAGKKLPYLYTQCQPIHARSMLPCMDTPSVKTTYSAEVTAPSELTALMSAVRKGAEVVPDFPGKTVTRFEQSVPIPAYLFALVVGALEGRSVGPRSKVWCEKELIEQAEWEFSETDSILRTAEDIAGPYLWGVYDVLVLPPSFPYGGMENPCLTFMSPTLLSTTIESGDKSSASRTVAHEVSHSWTGNLVTNVSWEHFWLNEGWTTYLERKVIACLYGEKERHLHYIIGWKSLGDAIKRFEELQQPSLSAMVPNLAGIHPDDAFSTVPYEKGSLFLFYLETLLGGTGSMDEFIKHYVDTFKFVNVNTDSWKGNFLNFFKKQASEGLFEGVEWEKWFYASGPPPYTPSYDTTLADKSAALAEKWTSITEVSEEVLAQFSPEDLSMSLAAQQEFLNKLSLKAPLPLKVLEAMDSLYGMSDKQNSELKTRWLVLCLRCGMQKVFPLVVEFVTRQGRMKYTRPLYKHLFECGEEGKRLAVQTFLEHRSFYHVLAASQLERDLQLRQSK